MTEYKKKLGTRAEVFNGSAERTTGGLYKEQLMKNKKGVLVSRKKRDIALKQNHLKDFLSAPKNEAIECLDS